MVTRVGGEVTADALSVVQSTVTRLPGLVRSPAAVFDPLAVAIVSVELGLGVELWNPSAVDDANSSRNEDECDADSDQQS